MSGTTNKYAFEFLREISPSLVNVGKHGRNPHTFIASPYLSGCIGFDSWDGKLYMGIPDALFVKIQKLRIYSISYIPKHPCFFLVFDMDKADKTNHPFAIRFYLRPKLASLLSHFQKIHLVKINDNGEFRTMKSQQIPLPLREVDHLEWEDY
tara:strand:+ start:5860 stop:6315 length:456 start_codon:yes stop_codon:yes gene_type:complete